MSYPRNLFVLLAAAAFGSFPAAQAAIFTYTPSNTPTDLWSAGTDWSTTPASAVDTELTFVGGNTTVLADSLANTNTDDISGSFQLNILDLQGTGPATGAGTINIAATSPATGLALISNGATTPVVNLNALKGVAGLTYNISAPVTLTNDTLFTGSGTANFDFTGGITSSGQLTKTGTSILTLGGTSAVNNLELGHNGAGGSVVGAAGSSITIGVSPTNDELSIGFEQNQTSGTSNGTLDASATSSLTINVGTIRVGNMLGGNGLASGSLKLGVNNTITASSWFLVGYSDNAFTSTPSSVTTAAAGVTTIQAPRMTIGGAKANATFVAGAGSTVSLSGTSGGRAVFEVGSFLDGVGGSGSWSGSTDFSAGTFSGTLSSLTVGSLNSSGSASETGTLTLGSSANNHLDISGTGSVVKIGNYQAGSGTATGTVTIGNLDAASSIVSTNDGSAILIGDGTTAAKATGTLNLNGGTLTITTAGKAISGGTGTSTVNFNGTTLKAGADSSNWIAGLTNARVLAGGAKFDTNSHNITISQALTSGVAGDGGLAKQGAGVLTLSGVSTYLGATNVMAGTLLISGAVNGSTLLSVASGATLQLETASSLNDAIRLTLVTGTNVDLDFTGQEVIGQLLIDGQFVGAGSYTLLQLQQLGTGVTFSGNSGSSLMVSAVPEPATLALFALSACVLLFAKRTRFRRAE